MRKLLSVCLGTILLSGSAFGIKEEEEKKDIRRFNTPFISCGEDPSGKGSCLVLDKTIYQSLLKLPAGNLVEFNQFETERNTKTILRLERFTASDNGDDLDKVVLLRGAAFQDDSYSISSDDYLSSFQMEHSRTAFIALSPYGSNGYIEIMNSTFILSTPWEINNDEEEKEDEESKKSRIPHNEYTSALRNQALRILPHIRNILEDFNKNYVSVIYNSAILDQPFVIPHNDYIMPEDDDFEEEGEQEEEDGIYNVIPKRSTPFRPTKEMIKTYKIASDVDYDMYKKKGSSRDATSSYYYTLIGHSGSIYRRDFGSDFVSSYVKIYDKPDPYPLTGTLTYMKQSWDPKTPSRSFAILISAKPLGGGVAYTRTLCNTVFAFGVCGSMVGSYPIPVTSYAKGNWDIYVFLHEIGHIWGASHTHSLNPPADTCGTTPNCPATKGTIMSYCHGCAGGMTNIQLAFHQRTKDQVKEFLATRTC